MPDDTPDTLRLTYAELAKARGITLAAARRITFRHRWPKQIGNDGLTRVTVPATAVVSTVGRDVDRDVGPPGGITDDTPVDSNVAEDGASMPDSMLVIMMADIMRIAATSEAAIVSLREQLAAANARNTELQAALDEQTVEHRRVVEALVARIPVRRTWRFWRR
jgi:hypothetical protein